MKTNKSIPVEMSEKAELLHNIVEFLSEQPYFIQFKKEIDECMDKKIKFIELFEKWYVNDGYTLDRKRDYAKKIMWLFSTYKFEAILVYSEWVANSSNRSDNVQLNSIRTIKNYFHLGLADGSILLDDLEKKKYVS